MKKIAVITPTYNRGDMLIDCIASVKNSHTDDELEIVHVIVDDGSSDNTKEVLKQVTDKNIKIISSTVNQGVSKSRNLGIEGSDSDYIFFLDSDDILIQNAIKYLFEFAETGNESCSCGDALQVNQKLSYSIGHDYAGRNFQTSGDMLFSMLKHEHAVLPTGFFRRDLVEKLQGFRQDLRNGEVTDFYLRILFENILPKHAKISTILRRIHGNNLSSEIIANPDLKIEQLKDFFKDYQKIIREILTKEQITELETLYG